MLDGKYEQGKAYLISGGTGGMASPPRNNWRVMARRSPSPAAPNSAGPRRWRR